jgi:hypothetical protein
MYAALEGWSPRNEHYANRLALVGAHCFNCLLSDCVSPVVAPTNLLCSIWIVGLASLPIKEGFEVTHYPYSSLRQQSCYTPDSFEVMSSS